MLTIIAIALAFLVLPPPWNVVAIVVAALVDTIEAFVFWQWSKRRKATVGVQMLVGRRAVVVRSGAPRGQVKLDGELWEARSDMPLTPGDEVVVRAVDGLVLDVTAAEPS